MSVAKMPHHVGIVNFGAYALVEHVCHRLELRLLRRLHPARTACQTSCRKPATFFTEELL